MAYRPIESHEEYLKNLEHYRDIPRDAWRSMTLEEKIDFFYGIHTDHVPMFDENGNDTLWTLCNYDEICKEFIQCPEMFSVTDISKFIDMLDDDCYQPSFMDDTLKVIRSIIRFHGKDGALYLLSHLPDVPGRGKEYGLCDSLRYLIVDDMAFPHLKEAVALADDSVRNLLSRILHGEVSGVTSPLKYAEGVERERICELEMLISSVSENK